MRKKNPKLLIVYKKSSYQEHVLDEKDAHYLRLLREGNRVVERSKSTHDVHMDTFRTVRGQLMSLGITFDVRLRTHLKPIRGYDLTLTIGGDGTFLETSHYLEDGCILGINSVPDESIGYYCHSTAENFLEKIYQFMEGRSETRILHRLSMTVDGVETGPPALNDILYANQNPAGTTRYLLSMGGGTEEQKSSGLWISPAPGSTAATRSAGGKILSLESKQFQFVVREPYAPPHRKYRFLRRTLSPGQKMEIVSMMDDAALFVDGPHRIYPVRRGSRIVIRPAKKSVRAIW